MSVREDFYKYYRIMRCYDNGRISNRRYKIKIRKADRIVMRAVSFARCPAFDPLTQTLSERSEYFRQYGTRLGDML